MIIEKPRSPSLELIRMSHLSLRMEFSKEEEAQLYNMRTGYEGEVMFDKILENIEAPDNWIVLNCLWLENNRSHFQIDSLLITPRANYIFDVKNFFEEYEFREDGNFYRNDKETKTNPLTQLDRCTRSYKYLLTQLGHQIPIISTLAFVNPEFTLHGNTKDVPLLLPSQLKSFLEKIKQQDLKYAANAGTTMPTPAQRKLAKQILSLDLGESPYTNLPAHSFETLKKGMICEKCGAFLAKPERLKENIICHECGASEKVNNCILRHVREYQLLLPNEKVTTNRIKEWCKVIDCSRRISRVLVENFKVVRSGKITFYTDND